MRISRIQIDNFRNFLRLDVTLSEHAVIVGENKVGKSNLLHALRLILDPTLPDSARQLRNEDFWDGLPRPLAKDASIRIAIDLTDFEDDEQLLAVLAEHVIATDPIASRLTYIFGPTDTATEVVREADYEFAVYGGDRLDNRVGPEVRRRLPLDLLPALRDAESDLSNWRRSPLRPLLDEAASNIDHTLLVEVAEKVTEATEAITDIDEISDVADQITDRLEEMVGEGHGLDATLGFSPTEPERLLRSLRLFIDDGRRGIADASLGSANLLYLTLKALELNRMVREGSRDHTFLAIEEPEAHLHPHVQRLVYRDFLRRRPHQEVEQPEKSDEEPSAPTTILLTTHSPHIVSVSPLNSFVLLRKSDDGTNTEGVSTASLEFDEKDRLDLERYLDVTRGEILFAKRVILVEGDAEMFLVPALAKLRAYDLDQLGITVCSVAGTNFTPYVKFLGADGLDIPFAVLTDLDPGDDDENLGEARVRKLLACIGKQPGNASGAALCEKASKHGFFLNECTLEVDLFKCGRHRSMCKTLAELAPGETARKRAADWLAKPDDVDLKRLIKDIEVIGKGRFAQRLATNMKGNACPEYIAQALAYVAKSGQ